MNVKKDILATFTFLTTALLFLVAHTGGSMEKPVAFEGRCPGVEAVSVGEDATTVPAALLLAEEGRQDS